MSNSGIRDNKNRGSVGEFLEKYIEKDSQLLFLSAYFTVYAYGQLKEKLNSIKEMKFLFGEPTFINQKNILKPKNYKIDLKEMVEREKGVSDIIAYDISLDERLKQSVLAKECVEWIKDKVEIKSLVKPNFLHGKMYHITHSNGREFSIMGSSNFTYNGLGFGNSNNIELNLITDSNRDIVDLKNWFLEIWNDSNITVDVKQDVINYLQQYYKENSPEFLYYFTLFHIFGENIGEHQEDFFAENFTESKIWNMLYDFQKSAVKAALKKLSKHGGCIIADSVGLGKTFEALAIIKYYETLGKKVLVLCPKRLSENWKVFTEYDEKNILRSDDFRYAVRYHTDLAREGKHADGSDLGTFTWSDFDLVVIDESHNFRNNRPSKKVTRYEWLFENVIKKGRKTDVLMLSATPVNNRLTDLRNQISLATKGNVQALNEEGIQNINYTLSEAQKIFNEWAKTPEKRRRVKNLVEQLSNTDFIKLLDTFTIARSRKHIRNHFDIDAIGGFPERLKPYSIYSSELDLKKNSITYDEINSILEKLNLAIFSPISFLKEECKNKYKEKYDTKLRGKGYFTQEDRESHLIGMMKVNYLKRLESSIQSFNLSIKRLIDKIEYAVHLYESNSEYIDFEQDDLIDLDSDEENELEYFVGKKIKILIRDISPIWKEKLIGDLIRLRKLYFRTSEICLERDAKLNKLKEIIYEKVLHSKVNGKTINTGNKKLIIFTAYSDTAEYIYESIRDYCLTKLKVDIGLVTGSGRCKTTFQSKSLSHTSDFNSILTNFSPNSKYRSSIKSFPQDKEIDVLIATDCISEGQNLQDCDCVVNYDIHWNPVRILQRFGRVDRITSGKNRNKKVMLVNFWATEDLNKYIKLNERVKARMAIVNITATGDEGNIIGEQEAENYTLSFREKQLLRMKDEILDIEEFFEHISLTEFNFNDFRMDILNYIKENFNSFDRLPKGLYAICPAEFRGKKKGAFIKPGILFCLKRVVSEDKKRKSNPIEPYYLLYVYNTGEIAIGYSNAKEVLSMYRMLCIERNQPFEDLCEIFNRTTNNGSNMGYISKLLDVCIKGIKEEARNSSNKTVRFDRSLKIFSSENQKRTENQKDEHFELISFLILI